jgi:hypothetical protein
LIGLDGSGTGVTGGACSNESVILQTCLCDTRSGWLGKLVEFVAEVPGEPGDFTMMIMF